MIVFAAGASLASYLLVTIAGPRIDGLLAETDAVVGFNWPSTIAAAGRSACHGAHGQDPRSGELAGACPPRASGATESPLLRPLAGASIYVSFSQPECSAAW